jgi:hypothetical protein
MVGSFGKGPMIFDCDDDDQARLVAMALQGAGLTVRSCGVSEPDADANRIVVAFPEGREDEGFAQTKQRIENVIVGMGYRYWMLALVYGYNPKEPHGGTPRWRVEVPYAE